MDFNERLHQSVQDHESLVCVGLDVDKQRMPGFLFESCDQPYTEFCRSIIDQTKDDACAYKLNLAFYEAIDGNGFQVVMDVIRCIPKKTICILDGKRNDIGNTAKKYAEALFDRLGADAITVNPYLGWDGIEPFLSYIDRCSFILCRTSNPSAGDFQDLITESGDPLFVRVSEKIKEWSVNGCCGAVVGATYPDELQCIRELLGDDIPLLIPGIGKQGGDIETTVRIGTNNKGEQAIINSSRGIIYAGSGEDYAEQAGRATKELKDQINSYRNKK
jgi:orotidine-5'-phosphate decarboxylase